jgi:hypothetical protein
VVEKEEEKQTMGELGRNVIQYPSPYLPKNICSIPSSHFFAWHGWRIILFLSGASLALHACLPDNFNHTLATCGLHGKGRKVRDEGTYRERACQYNTVE